MIRRIVLKGLLAAMLLVLMVFRVPALAESGRCGDQLTWRVENRQLIISGTGKMWDYPDDWLATPWSDTRFSYSQVIIEEGVTSIGKNAKFSTGVIHLPDSLYEIGASGITGGSVVMSVRHPYLTMLDGALCRKADMRMILWMGDTRLEEFAIPEGIRIIGEGACRGMTELTSLSIPDSVTTIEKGAFRECKSLTAVTIPDTVALVTGNPFPDCPALAEIIVSDSHPYLEFTGGMLFSKPDNRLICCCPGLGQREFTVPEGTREIGDSAFEKFSSLEKVVIPDTVVRIGEQAFASCGWFSAKLPDSIETIGRRAFIYCESFGASRYSMNRETGERSLEPFRLPASLTEIGPEAFCGCSDMQVVEVPDSVRIIGDRAFSRCMNLLCVSFGSGIEHLGEGMFSESDSMVEVSVPQDHPYLEATDGLIYTRPDARLLFCPKYSATFAELLKATDLDSVKMITDVTVKPGTRIIDDSIFYWHEELQSVSLPDSLEKIGSEAFAHCSSLKFLTIPASVTEIGSDIRLENGTVGVFRGSYAERFFAEKGTEVYVIDVPGGPADETPASQETEPQASPVEDPDRPEPDYSLSVSRGSIIEIGRYEQDNDFDNGREPILWTVLDVVGTESLVASQSGLDWLPYHTVSGEDPDWEHCTLRKWLNDDFLTDAFSSSEQAAILVSQVDNSDGQHLPENIAATSGGNDTEDRIFLLSYAEAAKYFSDENARRITATAFARDQSKRDDKNPAMGWLLRSPGEKQGYVMEVFSSGHFYNEGTLDYSANLVRPAMRVNLDDLAVATHTADDEPEKSIESGRPLLKVGEIVSLGRYEQDGDSWNGEEPIEWVVLSNFEDRTLLLTRYLLEPMAYDSYGGTTWATSDVRAWLNGRFFYNAFNEEERAMIRVTDVRNGPSQGHYDTDGGPDTEDRVFLLSYISVWLNDIPDDYKTTLTPAAIQNGAYIVSEDTLNGQLIGSWWMRSPGKSSDMMLIINQEGKTQNCKPIYTGICVRPAIWVDTATLDAMRAK